MLALLPPLISAMAIDFHMLEIVEAQIDMKYLAPGRRVDRQVVSGEPPAAMAIHV
jgi:hypothetical protein